MEVCLPAEFYQLRDALPVDWRDAPAAAPDHPWSARHLDSCPARDHVNVSTHAQARASDTIDADSISNDSINACADPSWKVF